MKEKSFREKKVSVDKTSSSSSSISEQSYAGKTTWGFFSGRTLKVTVLCADNRTTSICLSCIKPLFSLRGKLLQKQGYVPMTIKDPTTKKTSTVYVGTIEKKALEVTLKGSSYLKGGQDQISGWNGTTIVLNQSLRDKVDKVFTSIYRYLKDKNEITSIKYQESERVRTIEKIDEAWVETISSEQIHKGGQATVFVVDNLARKCLRNTTMQQAKKMAEKETDMEKATSIFNTLTDFTPIKRVVKKEQGTLICDFRGNMAIIKGHSYTEPVHLGDCKNTKISSNRFRCFAACVTHQLIEYHNQRIYHVDIKPENMIGVKGENGKEYYRHADMNNAWEAQTEQKNPKDFIYTQNRTTQHLAHIITNNIVDDNKRELACRQTDLLALTSSIFSVLMAASEDKIVKDLGERKYPYHIDKKNGFALSLKEDTLTNIEAALGKIPDLSNEEKTNIKDVLFAILQRCGQPVVLLEDELTTLSEKLRKAFPKKWITASL